MVNKKLKYGLVGLFFSLMIFFGFSLFYKVQNVIVGNVVETNQTQIIQVEKNNKINVWKGANFSFKYNNKKLEFKIANYYIENNSYFITLNKYLVIENNIYNLFINTNKEILLLYILDNIF